MKFSCPPRNALVMIVQKRRLVDMFLGSFDPNVVQDNEGEEMVNVFCLFVRLKRKVLSGSVFPP